ncbi:hypothetical protein [Paenibacillus solani]|uniref:hypothetical protein n=1 Tax=Paenibacillus solani TaxID=1705565 RepID=UPI003D26D4DE
MDKAVMLKALDAISFRIKDPVHKDINNTAQKLPKSSALVENSYRVLNDSLKLEVLRLIEDISNTRIKISEVIWIDRQVVIFVHKEYEKHKDYLKKINAYNIGNRDYSAFINELQNDLLSTLEIKIAILKSDLIRKRNKGLLEIGRMVLSALIGALIGWGIKHWTGG